MTREKLGLVIPTLNEAGNMQTLLNRLQVALGTVDVDYELIVVDDNSSDGTAEIVQTYAERDPRVRLFVRKGQRGLAGAVIHGWAHTDATLFGVIDADLQHPPEVLPKLLSVVLEGKDIAIASRYATNSHESVRQWSKARLFISRASTWATTPLQRKDVRIKDPMSGFFVVRRECIESIELHPQGFKILLEILVKGRIKSAVEVPFLFATRHSGKSKADVKVALHYFSLLGKLSRYALFGSGQQ
ncbi:MAG: glycosyl transferase family 2 protein 2 [Acidobacteriaceae bacterium]|nr:glycosyl transferase family 2 protein 2 [Acidobacteriaceae bacterium]